MAAVWILLATLVTGSLAQTVYWPVCGGSEQDALDWTVEYNAKTQQMWPVAIQAEWTYNTDITPENQAAMVGTKQTMGQISDLIIYCNCTFEKDI